MVNASRSAAAGIAIAGLMALAITLAIAWPVVLHPNTMIYGREILGRHPDPYVTIQQLGGASDPSAPTQPLTDGLGRILAQRMSPVAAYNLLVLLSFPLSAMAAYALGRYLMRSHGAAVIAALAFAFSPAHLAQAAYHPHFIQTQWIPLFVLALLALVDRFSMVHIVATTLACAALVLANADGAVIGVVMAPVILATYWALRDDADHNPWPFLGPMAVVSVIAIGLGLLVWTNHLQLGGDGSRVGYGLEDIGFYRARWWTYLTPAVDNPLLAPISAPIFDRSDVTLQLTESQLYLGWALLCLAGVALVASIASWRADPRRRWVPAALAVGVVAALISLGPTAGACLPSTLAPACLIYGVAPVFGVYARFGVITQLMVALAAGLGASVLAHRSSKWRGVAVGLLALATVEYWPWPARAHDVLPTSAHRWLASAPDGGRTLDCYPAAPDTALPWLMQRDITFLSEAIEDCTDPELGSTLAGMKVSQVLVRRSAIASALATPLPVGITLSRSFPDADLYAVSQTPPAIVTVQSTGFWGREHAGTDWWRWMSPSGRWVVRNTTGSPQRVTLSVNLQPIGAPRRLTLTMGDAPGVTQLLVMNPQDVTFGPWTLGPGDHELAFAVDGEPVRPAATQGGDDQRLLTVSFRNERWILDDGR